VLWAAERQSKLLGARGLRVREIRDQNLSITLACFSLRRVVEIDPVESEATKQFTDFRRVIQRQNKLASNLPKVRFQFHKIRLGEVEAVTLPIPVRRIEIKESLRTVVARKNLLIRQAFDLHSLQTPMRFFNELWKALQVEPRRFAHVIVVRRIPHEACKTILLQIEESCGPLDVGQRFGLGRSREIEPLAANQAEPKTSKQLLVVPLTDTEKIDHLSVQIV